MIKFVLYSLLIALTLYNWQLFLPKSWYAPGAGDIEDILLSHGYPLETHQAKTEDGYILTLHRIPHGRTEEKTSQKEGRPTVFLMHGLLDSSVSWTIKGPKNSMALILADAGYDVWMGNNRGNAYSRHHENLHPENDKREFFNYSYHEIGLYDLPAMIDYVLDTTGNKQLTYLGYSEGFTSFVVMGSLRPEYNEKILLMNAFAPATNIYNITNLVFNFLARYPIILELSEQIGWYEMFPHDVSPFFRLFCNIKPLCRSTFYLTGASEEQLADQEFLVSILSNFPAGMSLKQLSHYVQGTRTGIFGYYNYGETENLKLHGSTDPPLYDLTKVTAPIILYYGENDNVVNEHILLNHVAKELPNVIKTFLVPYPRFNHLDFIWGKETSLLTKETLRNINSYNTNLRKKIV